MSLEIGTLDIAACEGRCVHWNDKTGDCKYSIKEIFENAEMDTDEYTIVCPLFVDRLEE